MMSSLAGNLLVASTTLDSPVFSKSVCLVVHHDAEGAIGLVLNRPLQPQPTELLALLNAGTEDLSSDAEQLQASCSSMVHFGGPLSGPVVALHASPTLAESETLTGVYVAAQKNHLEQLLKQTQAPMRLIVGHAGWGAGQLEAEIENGNWHVAEANTEIVFGNNEAMWSRLLRPACGLSIARWIGARPTPLSELN